VTKRIIMRTNVAAPEKLKNLKAAQFWLTVYLSYWFCMAKNTQMFNFSNDHFWPTPFPFLSYAPSLSMLIHWCHSLSLSPLLPQLSTLFHLLWFLINTPLIWWDSIIVINWLEVNRCFSWRLLTIKIQNKAVFIGCGNHP
jgi:hypothetical protein